MHCSIHPIIEYKTELLSELNFSNTLACFQNTFYDTKTVMKSIKDGWYLH